MQFSTESYSRLRSILKIKIVAVIVILGAISLYIYFQLKRINELHTDKSSELTVEKLLNYADSCIGNEPLIAEKKARQALNLCNSPSLQKYAIKAMLTLGQIQSVKGLYSPAKEYFVKAGEMARKNGLKQEYCDAEIRIGELIYNNGNYDYASAYFRKADSISSEFNIEPTRAKSLYFLGKYYHTKGNNKISREYYDKALEISRKNDYSDMEAIILPSLGKTYLSEGCLNKALECDLEAYHISAKIHNNDISSDICNSLGGIYLQMEEYQKALKYHTRALNIRKKIESPDGLAKSYNNIGEIYFQLKQTDSAEICFNKSLGICRDIGYKKGLVKSEINLGKVKSTSGRNAQALFLLRDALKTSREAGYDTGIAEALLALGNIYRSKNLPDSAINSYIMCLAQLNATNYTKTLRDAYYGLFETYRNENNFAKALEYHILLLDTEKELLNVEKNRQLATLNISFDNELKEKDNQVLRKVNELNESQIKRKTILIWLIMSVLSLSLLICFVIYNRFITKKRANVLLEALNKKIIQQNNELTVLNRNLVAANREKDKLFSIIAHELRNPLFWFQNLSEALSKNFMKMSPDKIRKTLASLDESSKNAFHLMDNLLNWSRTKLKRINPKKSAHTLRNLVNDTVRMYETILNHKDIRYNCEISDNIKIFADADLFCCVIRNLVSNSIKYTPEGGRINIFARTLGKNVTVVVEDNGVGMSENSAKNLFRGEDQISVQGLLDEKGSGVGLKLCKDFIEMNDGEIWASSSPQNGTKIFFTIPCTDTSINEPDNQSFINESHRAVYA